MKASTAVTSERRTVDATIRRRSNQTCQLPQGHWEHKGSKLVVLVIARLNCEYPPVRLSVWIHNLINIQISPASASQLFMLRTTAKSRFAFWTVQTQHATYRGLRHTGQIAPRRKRRTEYNVSAAFKVPRKGPAMLPFASRGACALFSGMFCCLELFLRPRNEPRTMTLDLDHGIVLWSAGGVWDAILFLRRYGAGNTTQFTRY